MKEIEPKAYVSPRAFTIEFCMKNEILAISNTIEAGGEDGDGEYDYMILYV